MNYFLLLWSGWWILVGIHTFIYSTDKIHRLMGFIGCVVAIPGLFVSIYNIGLSI